MIDSFDENTNEEKKEDLTDDEYQELLDECDAMFAYAKLYDRTLCVRVDLFTPYGDFIVEIDLETGEFTNLVIENTPLYIGELTKIVKSFNLSETNQPIYYLDDEKIKHGLLRKFITENLT